MVLSNLALHAARSLPHALRRRSLRRRSVPRRTPWQRRLAGKTLVVKYGGAAMTDEAAANAFGQDIAALRQAGVRVVVVHGGGPALTAMLGRLGLTSEFVDGHRVTTPEMAEVAEMVLSGTVNKQVVSRIVQAGALAVGLSGTDGGLLDVEPHRPDGKDIGQVGQVRAVRPEALAPLLAAGVVPVVSTTVRDGAGVVWNVNADVVAAAVAGALGAERLVFLSDTPGVRDGDVWLSELHPEAAKTLLATGEASGGMRPKLEAALEACAAGVATVDLVDGRVVHALRSSLRGDAKGTTLSGTVSRATERAA